MKYHQSCFFLRVWFSSSGKTQVPMHSKWALLHGPVFSFKPHQCFKNQYVFLSNPRKKPGIYTFDMFKMLYLCVTLSVHLEWNAKVKALVTFLSFGLYLLGSIQRKHPDHRTPSQWIFMGTILSLVVWDVAQDAIHVAISYNHSL